MESPHVRKQDDGAAPRGDERAPTGVDRDSKRSAVGQAGAEGVASTPHRRGRRGHWPESPTGDGASTGGSLSSPVAWPGFAPDVAERWGRVSGVKPSDITSRRPITKDPTIPKGVIGRRFNRKAQAADGLARVKARVESGELNINQVRKKNRSVLVEGESTHTPALTIAMILRFVPGGRKTAVEMIQAAAQNGDSAAKRWCLVWDDLRQIEQQRANMNAICEVAGIAPKDFMAIVISTAMEIGTDAADMTAALMHPRVVKQTAKSALRIGGEHASIAQQDRQWMLEHGKFIAPPKGISITQNASAQAAAAAAAAQPSVPTFMDSIRNAGNATREIQRQLASVDAEVE